MIITDDKIKLMHQLMAQVTGGSVGVRDEGILNSALAGIYEGFGEVEFYPSKEEKAARLCYNIVTMHPFLDGNKRAGVHSMMVLLELTGIHMDCSDEDLVGLGISVADGSMTYEEIVSWVHSHKRDW